MSTQMTLPAMEFVSQLDPFDEYLIIAEAAHKAGLCDIYSRERIDVDLRQLPPEYLKKAADYSKIRAHLELGVEIPGAKLTGATEYTLSRIPEPAE